MIGMCTKIHICLPMRLTFVYSETMIIRGISSPVIGLIYQITLGLFIKHLKSARFRRLYAYELSICFIKTKQISKRV